MLFINRMDADLRLESLVLPAVGDVGDRRVPLAANVAIVIEAANDAIDITMHHRVKYAVALLSLM